jgi:short-subunit dehydrogenase
MTDKQPLGTALITGASSGIGAMYAIKLAERGYDLILVARDRLKLEAVATQIGSKTGRSVRFLPSDLTECYDIACIEELLRSDPSITMLVNNAGFGSTASVLEADADRMQTLINLNVTALTRLTYAVVPQLVQRGHGTIINISSIVAVAPELLNGVYGGSKAFVLAFTQSLHHELQAKGIRIQAVLPPGTRTQFFSVAGTPIETMTEERRNHLMSTEDLVEAALAGLDQGELVTLPSLPNEAEWDDYEAARQKMIPNLLRPEPADPYRSASQT